MILLFARSTHVLLLCTQAASHRAAMAPSTIPSELLHAALDQAKASVASANLGEGVGFDDRSELVNALERACRV
jgi:hypothetical protein